MKRLSPLFSCHNTKLLTLILTVTGLILLTTFLQDVHAAVPLKVVGRFLQDANGNNTMIRGVNIPVYKSGWADDLDQVAAAVATTKTNVVRLEWWANPPAGTNQYTVANLDRALQKYADLGIVPMIELHDLTFVYGHNAKAGLPNSDGNDRAIFAATITQFFTRSDVLAILLKHQNHLLINFANEWGSSTYSDGTSTAANFIANYTTAITAMRAAGITAPLIVDAPQGSEYQFILDNGQAILNADLQKNTLLSIHAYWAASSFTAVQVNGILDSIKNSGLPIILGEVSSNAWTNIQCDPVNYGNLLTKANTNVTGYLIWAWYEDGTCGTAMNISIDGSIILTAANPGFGYDALNSAGYGINTAVPATTKIATSASGAAAGSKVLILNRAIANWPGNVPAGEKRPVVVFLPGWGGAGNVNASVSAQNTNLVNQGYVTLAIGFDDTGGWTSNLNQKTKDGLDQLCADAAIPANCNAIVLDGESYGGIQNYMNIEYLRSVGYAGGAGSTGKALGFVSEDAGYAAPGNITNLASGAFTRTGLADTASYSVAMIQNLGDTTFPVDECTWGNCGTRLLSNAHLVRGDTNVWSTCAPGGEHGTRGFVDWDVWVVSAIKTMIHSTSGVPTFTGYSNPLLPVSNACVTAAPAMQLTVTPVTGAGFTITPATPQAINSNTTTSFTVTPLAGFGIASVSGCGGSLSGSAYKTGSVTTNCSVTVTAIAKNASGSGTSGPTISDALIALQAAVGTRVPTVLELIRYDVAPLSASGTPIGNFVIDAADVILILRRSIGIGSW
jgi:mannan endo-1,4-beta-mannosidase